MVETTTVAYSNEDITSSQLMDVWTQIFPEYLEQGYVELTNLLVSYCNNSLELLQAGSIINALGKQLPNVEKTREERVEIGDITIAQINSMRDTKMTMEQFRELEKQLTTFLESARLEVTRNREHERLDNDYENNRLQAGNNHSNISNLIIKIQEQLQILSKLTINGQDRLDRIQVTERHLSQIDNVSGLSPERQEIFKRLLISYTNMRVSAFKASIEHAHEIIEAYKNREIINYNKNDDPRVQKYTLVLMALVQFLNDFRYRIVEHLPHQISDQSFINMCNNLGTAMELYISYFNGDIESLDVDQMDNWLLNNRYVDPQSILTLRNIVATQQLKENSNIK